MLSALDPSRVIDFSLADDDESPTVFKLKVLTGREFAQLKTHLDVVRVPAEEGQEADEDGMVPDIRADREGMEKALRMGLRGWENYSQEWIGGDKPTAEQLDQNIDLMPWSHYRPVASKIILLALYPEGAEKNSPSPSQ